MKYCKDCNKPKSNKGDYCKRCGYKHRGSPINNPSYIKKGEHLSPKTEFRKGQTSIFKGKKFSLESRLKLSKSLKGNIPWNKGKKGLQAAWNKGKEGPRGEKHPNWQGGITPIRKRIMGTIEYRAWRKYIFKKDNYSCQICYSKTKLEIHHIEPVAKNSSRIIDGANGITLCNNCHNYTKRIFSNKKEFKNKKILLTGGHGFLGKHLVEQFKNNGINIITPSSREFNLINRLEVVAMLKKYKPDIIIHAAALVGGIGFNQKYPADLFYKNLVMGINIIHFSTILGVEKIVVLGTICAYPKITPIPFKEENLWNGYPETTNASYGLAKKMLLVMAQAYRRQYGMNIIYLLPVNLYGEGDNFEDDSSHVIPALIKKFVNAKDEVVIWGTGKPTREFLYVGDAAQGIYKATMKYNGSEPVNLGSGMEISIKDLAYKIADIVGYKGKIVFDKSKPDGQPRRSLDVSRALKFGFKAKTPFDKGLRKVVSWYLKSRALSPQYGI